MQIKIRDMRLYAGHGVMAQERVAGNTFIVDATIDYDARVAMAGDDIASAVNYAEAVEVIRAEILQPSALLENAVYRAGRRLLETFPAVTSVKLSLTKTAPPIAGCTATTAFSATFSR